MPTLDYENVWDEVERFQRRAVELETALRLFRSLVKEGGVPRYTIQPGAALNSLIEETIDPLLKR